MNIIQAIKNHQIISALILLLFLSVSYLSWTEFSQKNPNKPQNWWAVYFEDAKSPSLDFTIENKAEKNDFTWKVSIDDKQLLNGSETIDTNQTKKIEISDKLEFESSNRIIIEITKAKERKTIYKNL